MARSAEDWLARLNRVIESYREQIRSCPTDERLLTAAIACLKDLGLNEGDALRYLKPHLKGH